MNPDELARLEEERNFLLDSLRDVERERSAGDIDDDDYATLKSGYTQRAADVLKAIEAGQSTLNRRAPKSRAKAIGVSFAIVVFACLAGWLLASQSGQRLPGQTSTGGIENSTASLLSQARAINFSDPQKAIELYNDVVKLDPDNVEALTYRSWLIALIARDAADDIKIVALAAATQGLERAIQVDPKYPDAHCFLGIVRFRLAADAVGAKEQLDICAASNPPAEVMGFVSSIIEEVNATLAG
jgi:tetratricopeptide (TPR) repeat protein